MLLLAKKLFLFDPGVGRALVSLFFTPGRLSSRYSIRSCSRSTWRRWWLSSRSHWSRSRKELPLTQGLLNPCESFPGAGLGSWTTPLGVESFIKNGVRPALIPVLVNYFQDRVTLGILEYLSQSNNNADFLKISDRFKFVDDLTVLEIIDLLTVGITSYNIRAHVPSDIPIHNQYIPAANLKSQYYLDEISNWTKNQKMMLNENKTKNLVFNFTDKYQFATRLEVNGKKVETLSNTKLLGTI